MKLYDRKKLAGICVFGGCENKAEGTVHCEKHRVELNEKKKLRSRTPEYKTYMTNYMKDYMPKYIAKRRKELIKRKGSKCEHCNNDDSRVLQLHHKKEKLDKLSYERRFSHLFKSKDDEVLLLCANCHLIEHSNI